MQNKNKIKNNTFSYLSTHFSFSIDKLASMKNGDKGQEKKLLFEVMNSWDINYIEGIENNTLIKNKDINYTDINLIAKLFNWRKNQLKTWESKQKKLLLNCLQNTPVAYIYWCATKIEAEKNFTKMFPQPKDYQPIKKKCEKCSLKDSCYGLKIKIPHVPFE